MAKIKINGVVQEQKNELPPQVEKVRREVPTDLIIHKKPKQEKKAKQVDFKPKEEFIMTTTDEKKVSLSYSRLRNYLICPKRFEFHSKYGWNPTTETKKNLQAGLIFEALLLGDKNEILGLVDLEKKYEKMVKQANHIKNQGFFAEGESYLKVAYEHEFFSVRGEIDYIGKFMQDEKLIVDLKYTGKIDYIWQDFKYKEDTLQLLIYSWIWWKNTGEVLNCAYCIVESSYDEPVVQIRKVFVSIETYEWLENFLLRVAIEPIKLPNPSQVNCLGSKGKARCAWLQYCESGRNLLGGIQEVDSSYLPSKTENNLSY